MNSPTRRRISCARSDIGNSITVPLCKSSLRRDQPAAFGQNAEMVVGVTEHGIDHGDALEIVPDARFHGHADAAVDLDRLLADEAAGPSYLHLCRRYGLAPDDD